MNRLIVDPKTGFLDSNNINGFSAERKTQFIAICNQYRIDNNGKWPDFSKVCEALGITNTTLDRHLNSDPAFKEQFRNLLLGAKWKLESHLYDLGTKKGFEALIWLRRWFPSEYNPEYKGNITVDVNVVSSLVDKARALDAEIVSTPDESMDKSI